MCGFRIPIFHLHVIKNDFILLADDKPERIHKQLESFAAAESGAGEVKVSKLEFVKLSPVSSTNSLGFQLIKRAAMETLRGPEVLIFLYKYSCNLKISYDNACTSLLVHPKKSKNWSPVLDMTSLEISHSMTFCSPKSKSIGTKHTLLNNQVVVKQSS